MPFKSKSQIKYMFLKHPKIAKRWAKKTYDIKSLPSKLTEELIKKTKLRKKA